MIKKSSESSQPTLHSPTYTLKTFQQHRCPSLGLTDTLLAPHNRGYGYSFQGASRKYSAERASKGVGKTYFEVVINGKSFLIDCSSTWEAEEDIQGLLRVLDIDENTRESLRLIILQKMSKSHSSLVRLLDRAAQEYSFSLLNRVEQTLKTVPECHD